MQLYTPLVDNKFLQGRLRLFYDLLVLAGVFKVFSEFGMTETLKIDRLISMMSV